MAITTDELAKIAELARLELTDEESERFTGDLNAILQHVEQLAEVDVTGVAPTSQVTGLQNVLRDDVVAEGLSLTPEQTEQFTPKSENGYLVVPAVLDKGDE